MATAVGSKPDSRDAMQGISGEFRTKSDKIRALASAGYSRSEIADFLGIRYQHVRNVLVNDARVARGAETGRIEVQMVGRDAASPSESSQGANALDPTASRIGPDGRLPIPASFLAAVGLKPGDPAILSVEADAIRVMSVPASVRRVQAMVRKFVPEGVSLVDELLAERRLEAEREDDING